MSKTNHKTAPGRRQSLLALAAAGLLLSGCAALNSYPPAPQTVESQDHRYKIGPLDTLNILVWRNPELSATVTVRPDGRISAPWSKTSWPPGATPPTSPARWKKSWPSSSATPSSPSS